MAAVIRSACDNNSTCRRSFAPAHARLAVAVTLSALVHLWLAAEMEVDAPVPTAPHGPAITARLELSVTPPVIPLPLQTETSVAEKIARQDSRPPGGPIHDGKPGSSATSLSSAPMSAAEAPGMRTADPALPRPADPVYYPARQLDVYPALLQPIRLEYPERASHDKVGGRVQAVLLIDEMGGVNEVSLVEFEPPGYFEDALRHVFSGARFSPARKDGRAVKSRVLISVTYNPGEAEGFVR